MAINVASLGVEIESLGGDLVVRQLRSLELQGQKAALAFGEIETSAGQSVASTWNAAKASGAAGNAAGAAAMSYRGLSNSLLNMATRASGVPVPLAAVNRQLLALGMGGTTFLALSAGLAITGLLFGSVITKANAAAKALHEIPQDVQIRLQIEDLTKGVRFFEVLRAALVTAAGSLPGTVGSALTAIVERVTKKIGDFAQAVDDGTAAINRNLLEAESALGAYFTRWERFDAQARLWARRNDITLLTGSQRDTLLDAERAMQQYIMSWDRWDADARRWSESARLLTVNLDALRGVSLLPIGGMKLEGLEPTAGLTEAIRQAFANIRQSLEPAMRELEGFVASGQAVQQAIVEMGTGVADAFGDLIAGTNQHAGNFAIALSATAGRILRTLGQTLIGIGIAKSIADAFQLTPGPAMIAAGIAITALGASLQRATGEAAAGVFGGSRAGAGAWPGGGLPMGGSYQTRSLYVPSSTSPVPAPASGPPVNVWAIGVNDPAAQRQIETIVRKAYQRGIRG